MFIIPSHSSNFGAGCGPEKIMYTYNTNTAYMYVYLFVVLSLLRLWLSTCQHFWHPYFISTGYFSYNSLSSFPQNTIAQKTQQAD